MKKINFRMLLVLIGVLITSFTSQVWAAKGFFDSGQWNIKYYDGGGSDSWGSNSGYGNGGYIDLGIKTTLYLKGSWVKTWSDDNWTQSEVKWYVGFTNESMTYQAKVNKSSEKGNQTWSGFDINYNFISNAPNNPGHNTAYMYWRLDDYVSTSTSQIRYTIPGFTNTSIEKSFGTSIPVNTESETTISFGTHYGTALTTSNCALSGTNASMFTVRSINESGVTVSFSPGNSTGAKSATLTITDAHNKTCTITLTATVVAKGTTTKLYFNDYEYSGAGDWDASSALYRFSVAYTSGVYTHYPMTKCDNTEHTFSADVEIKSKTVTIDRYNPNSPYQTWNTATPSPALSVSKPYAKSTTITGAYAADHPYNDVTGGMFYYDNSESGFTNYLYLLIGRDYVVSTGASGVYSDKYALTNITNTKLYYNNASKSWHDATFYAVVANTSSSPSWGTAWGSSTISTKGTNGYTAAYTSLYGLLSGSTYLASSPSNTGGTMMITQSPTLTTTQTFNYALSTDGGSSFNTMTSGSPNTPGKLSMATYGFANAACTTVVAKSAQELAANATTYSKAVSSVALTAATTLTASEKRDGYTFVGWYEGSTLATASAGTTSVTYYPNANKTLTARYKAHRYTIAFDNNDTQYSSAPAATGEMSSITNVVYDQSATLTENGFEREGYEFAGWNTEADGNGTPYSDEAIVSNLTSTDGATVTLYAQWNETTHTVTVQYRYGEVEIDDDGEVTGVGITTAQEVTAPTPIGGYSFTTWSAMPSGVTKASGELTDATISINATADGQTIVANYEPATYNGTLEGVDGSDGTYSVVYGETSLTVTGDAPARTGYHPQGYYLYYDGTLKNYSNPIAYASETSSKELVKSAPAGLKTYTDEDGKWIYTESAPMIYVQWTPNPYDITLTANLPGDKTGTTGTAKIAVTMNSATFTPSTRVMPTENGYDFLGYYTDEEAPAEDVQIFYSSGAKVNDTKYIDADGFWVWPDNITAYGLWEPKTYTVTLNDEGADSGKEGTTGITATFDATTNLTSAITKPQKSGYTFGGYYTEQGGSGSRLINENGAWIKDVDGYTGHSGDNPTWKYYTDDIDLYAKWTQDITLNQNGADKNGTTSLAATYNGALSTGGITNPNKIGYAFAGWATAASEGSVVIEPDGTVNTVTNYTDGSGNWVHAGASTLYAKWTSDVNNFKADAATTDWNTSTNWSKGEVPTDDYSTINILGNVVMSSGTSAFVGAVTIDGGSLTINAGAVLEVAGTVTNSDASKLVIKSNSTAQGALIFDNSASAKATVDIYTKLDTYDSYQVIAIPVTTTGVSESFAGSGVYTYVWNEGDGWERRGYYNDLSAFEAIGLMQTASHTYTISGTLASTDDFSKTLAYTTGTYQGTNVFGNSWTAPIKIKEISIPADKAEQTVNILENGNWIAYTLGSVTNQVVPAMQAFAIVATASGGSVSINYNDAVRGATTHTDALRAPQRTTSEDQEEMALVISDGERHTALRLREDSRFTDDFDNGWEARYLEGDGLSGQLYVQKENRMVVLAEPDLEGTVVGLIPGVASSYTISFEGDGEGYYLNDMVTEQSTLIAEGNTYMFTSDENTNATRFVISRMPINQMPTDIDNVQGDNVQSTKARKQMIDDKLYIIRDGRIYSAQGALVK